MFLLKGIFAKKIFYVILLVIFILYVLFLKKVKNGKERTQIFNSKVLELKEKKHTQQPPNILTNVIQTTPQQQQQLFSSSKCVDREHLNEDNSLVLNKKKELLPLLLKATAKTTNQPLLSQHPLQPIVLKKTLLEDKYFVVKIRGNQIPSVFLRDKIQDIFVAKGIENIFFDESSLPQQQIVTIDIYANKEEDDGTEKVIEFFIRRNYESFLKEDFYASKNKRYRIEHVGEFVVTFSSSSKSSESKSSDPPDPSSFQIIEQKEWW